MLFKPEMCQAALDGKKGQTRRLVQEGEFAVNQHGRLVPDDVWGDHIDTVYSANGHVKWQVGRTYAIQPGRGKKAVGRFLLTGIRRERLQDISDEDAMAEGVYEWYKATQMSDSSWTYWLPVGCSGAAVQFQGLWNSIHCKKGTRWSDNAEVWVLELELVSTLKEV